MSNGQYDDTNRGVLFPNDRKKAGSREADYRGTLDVEGVVYNLSAWEKIVKKEGKNKGKKFLSLKLESVDQDERQQSRPYPQPQRTHSVSLGLPQSPRNIPMREENPFNDDDESIPF